MLFQTPRFKAVLLAKDHAERLSVYYESNKSHLTPWEPLRPAGYHSKEAWLQRCHQFEREYQQGTALRILAIRANESDILGVCFFTNVSRGVFQACNIGYSVSAAHGGKGIMTELVKGSVDYLFEHLDLHRVMANYVPENHRSARILEKLGFEKEGYAKSYLQIAGTWRDHILTAKINPNHLENT